MIKATRSFTPADFLRPLDAIQSDREHQSLLCDQLVELTTGSRQVESVMAEVDNLLVYLTKELPFHHKDEEEDLFRMLRRRCQPEDQVDKTLAELDMDHAAEMFLVRHIVIDLKTIADGNGSDRAFHLVNNLRTLAEDQQRHLAWENNVVLPLARKRLNPADLAEMGHNMADRRGVRFPR